MQVAVDQDLRLPAGVDGDVAAQPGIGGDEMQGGVSMRIPRVPHGLGHGMAGVVRAAGLAQDAGQGAAAHGIAGGGQELDHQDRGEGGLEQARVAVFPIEPERQQARHEEVRGGPVGDHARVGDERHHARQNEGNQGEQQDEAAVFGAQMRGDAAAQRLDRDDLPAACAAHEAADDQHGEQHGSQARQRGGEHVPHVQQVFGAGHRRRVRRSGGVVQRVGRIVQHVFHVVEPHGMRHHDDGQQGGAGQHALPGARIAQAAA